MPAKLHVVLYKHNEARLRWRKKKVGHSQLRNCLPSVISCSLLSNLSFFFCCCDTMLWQKKKCERGCPCSEFKVTVCYCMGSRSYRGARVASHSCISVLQQTATFLLSLCFCLRNGAAHSTQVFSFKECNQNNRPPTCQGACLTRESNICQGANTSTPARWTLESEEQGSKSILWTMTIKLFSWGS